MPTRYKALADSVNLFVLKSVLSEPSGQPQGAIFGRSESVQRLVLL